MTYLCQELLGWTGMSMSRLLILRLSVFWVMWRYYERGAKGILSEWWRREILMTGPSSQRTLLPPLAAFFCCDAAVRAMQSEISYRYFPSLLAWPSGYLSAGLNPGFLKGFKRNCYWLNSGVIYNGNPVSYTSRPPQKSWALNLNLGESEAQFALFSFQDIGFFFFFSKELKVLLKMKVSMSQCLGKFK